MTPEADLVTFANILRRALPVSGSDDGLIRTLEAAAVDLMRLREENARLTQERDEAQNRADRLALERDVWREKEKYQHECEVKARERVTALEGLLRECVDPVSCDRCDSRGQRAERLLGLLNAIDAALTPGEGR